MKESRRLASSAISSADYDDETQILTVTFTNGNVYPHPGVPRSVFEELCDSSSAGRYYAQFIRGQY